MAADNVEVAKLLLDAGANADAVDNRGYKAVSYAIDPETYDLLQNKTTNMDGNGYLMARKTGDPEIQWKLNDMFMDAQEKLKTEFNKEFMDEMAPHKYEYILNNITPEKAEKLEKLVQNINENILTNSHETDSLDQLRGMSLNDINSDVISASAEKAAQQYVDEGGREGLKLLAQKYQNTPAYDLILTKYCDDDRYSYSSVKSTIAPFEDNRISQQDFLVLISNLGSEYIEKHEQDLRKLNNYQYKKVLEVVEDPDFYAKKFLESYCNSCNRLVGQYVDLGHGIHFSNAIKLPEVKEKCEQLWQKMLKDKDSYVSDTPLNYEREYVYISKEKIEQAKALFKDKEKTTNPVQRAVSQVIARRKIFAAIRDNHQERQEYTNAPFKYEMYKAGIMTYTQARRVIDLYWQVSDRPSAYNSPYNKYSVEEISKVVSRFNISKEADWMYPILLKAAQEGHLDLSSNKQPSERTLFDACKAWKVCPKMPLRLAKKVGHYSLSGRIIAGAVFDKLSKEKNLKNTDWISNKELQAKFYSTLSQYFKMERNEALKQLSNFIGKGNRKRLLYGALENQGFSTENKRFEPLFEEYKTKENISDIIENSSSAAHKGRFSNDEEFKYAIEHFDKKTLAESMIFRAQQRVMNVLVSASAQENGIEKAVAESFRKPDAPKTIKDYISNNNDWLIPASFKGAAIFKEYFPAYIKTIQNHNQKNPEDKLSIHDAVYWLPEPMSKEANERFAQFIQKNIIYQTVDETGKHKMVHRPLSELKIIAQNWKALEKKLQNQGEGSDITKLKYNNVLSICMSVKYEDQRNEVFAFEAAKHGTPEAEYHNCEDIYLAGLKVPEPFDSKKEFKEGKYTGRFLPRDDPRTLFFGDYTNCCQHYGGAGHACAVSTVKHPFSQLFVIEDGQGKIIAGSWTWENTEGKYRDVCFDNIESLGELSSRPELNKIYEQVGEYLTKEQNCHKVTIGLGFQDADVSGYKRTEAVELPKLYDNGYSDAHSQVLLSENPNAEPLDKTQESQRYIRDVCFLDMEAMDRVSYAVFPNGDKQLQAPDNMAGFVIEDREKGVVGYCLYDKEEKSIYDMAVLPEYRTDKNASSKKLFAEMMRTINKEGGQWSAEMRDETTLRYLKVMAERGLVKYEEHGIDHTMSDGSQVVAVTFEPIRRDVRQATNKLKQHIETNKETSAPAQSATIKNGRIGRNPTVYE